MAETMHETELEAYRAGVYALQHTRNNRCNESLMDALMQTDYIASVSAGDDVYLLYKDETLLHFDTNTGELEAHWRH